jgi:coenzyme F420 hydrogenase subunit beta
MITDSRGCRVPRGADTCATPCGRCDAVCPFAKGHPDEDELLKTRLVAANLVASGDTTPVAYVGHVTDEASRLASASGGLATWLLGRLLADDIVDAVACVGPGDGQSLFSYRLVRSAAELDVCRGSRYYPADMGAVLQEVRAGRSRVAVVGLPCALKGVARAMQGDARLASNVRVLVALTCGQMKSRAYTEYLALRAGLRVVPDTVNYRLKVEGRPSTEFRFRMMSHGSRFDTDWVGVPARLWTAHWFSLPACHYCDDLLGDAADVSFMDAWLEPYASDWRGTSIGVVRNASLLRYFSSDQFDRERASRWIAMDVALRSQATATRDKQAGVAHRLSKALARGLPFPERRVGPERAGSMVDRLRWATQDSTARLTLTLWAALPAARVSVLWRAIEWATEALTHVENVLRRLG